MAQNELGRRTLLGTAAAGGLGLSGIGSAVGRSRAGTGVGLGSAFDLHTQITYRALVDAVVPSTPALGDRLGAEHAPGGLEIGLAEFLITYVDGLFSFDPEILAEDGNLQLATPIAVVLDQAARALLVGGNAESGTSARRPLSLFDDDSHGTFSIVFAAGPFARLTRRDRLRAIGLLDDFEVELSPTDDSLFELDAGMLGQLVIGFTEMIYYSEWAGYDEYGRPPSERDHPNEPSAVQGWRQTGFPGYADGNAALRGYLGRSGSPLGAGEQWTVVDGGRSPVELTLEPGSFADNAYDTSDYEEPYPGEPAGPTRETGGGHGDGVGGSGGDGDSNDGGAGDGGDGPNDGESGDGGWF